ncbi:MAG: GntR family transcriptional regulator, partial [Planctomycetales bacterium]
WMLASDGLVEIQPGRRARVAEFGRDDLWEIFEMRKLLEGAAAESAAGRMDQRQFKPLRSAADALREKVNSADWTIHWADFDELFHQTIAQSCGNRRLAEDIGRYRLLHRGFNRVSTDYPSLQQALAEHFQILDALESRDGMGARLAMEAHIGFWQVYFAEKFHEQDPPPVRESRDSTKRAGNEP